MEIQSCSRIKTGQTFQGSKFERDHKGKAQADLAFFLLQSHFANEIIKNNVRILRWLASPCRRIESNIKASLVIK